LAKLGDDWEMSGDETVAFSETLNYTLNLAYQENWEMLGDEVRSPTPRACAIIAYYSNSPDIPIYQKAPFLHVHIQLWPSGKTLPSKNPAHTRMLLILISNTRGLGERRR